MEFSMKYPRFILPVILLSLTCLPAHQAVGMQFLRNLFGHGLHYLGLPAAIHHEIKAKDRDLSFRIVEHFNHIPLNKKLAWIEIELYEAKHEIGKAVVAIKTDSDTAYLALLHIIRDKRKNGFGGDLLEAVFAILKKAGFKRIHWSVEPFNLAEGEDRDLVLPKLIRFYENHGGIIDHTYTGTWPHMYRML
jgi:GNAT superfamily N-acetyltransferase